MQMRLQHGTNGQFSSSNGTIRPTFTSLTVHWSGRASLSQDRACGTVCQLLAAFTLRAALRSGAQRCVARHRATSRDAAQRPAAPRGIALLC